MTDLNPTSPQLQLFNKFKEAFLSRDLEGVRPLIAKSYVFQMLPKMPEEPDDSGEGMMQRHGRLLAAITKIEPDIHELIEVPGKVVVHAATTCLIGDTKIDHEVLCIFTFIEEDGELKIAGVKNFVDPQKVAAVYAAAAQSYAA